MSKMRIDLWCLLFVSTGMRDVTPEGLDEILKAVAEKRQLSGVTGLAIYANGNNLILMEGARESVREEYEFARTHPGHHSIIKLYDGPIPFRFFEDKPMTLKVVAPESFKRLEDLGAIEQEYFKEFLNSEHFVAKYCRNFIRNNT